MIDFRLWTFYSRFRTIYIEYCIHVSIRGDLAMRQVALVIAERIFRDEEYQVPKEILTKAGVKVLTACASLNEAVGKLGMKVRPDTLLKDLAAKDPDALIFIGGGGSSQYFDDPLAHELARSYLNRGKILGAICIAPVILANAGVLKGRKATVFPDGKERLAAGGAIYTGNLVEVDRTAPTGARIITGCGPEAAERFGQELTKLVIGD